MFSSRVVTAIAGIFLLILSGFLVFNHFSTRSPDEGTERSVRSEKSFDEETRGELVIVLDDCGYSTRNLRALLDLEVPVTLAVLPDTPYASHVARSASGRGKEVIVHMPMEPLDGSAALEKSTVKLGMRPEEIRKMFSDAVAAVPGAAGVNNHMGSKLTADPYSMEILFEEIGKRDLFFLDSLTTAGSVCSEIGNAKGVTVLKRDIFIDNVNDEDHIKGQMEKIRSILDEGGTVLAIGHDRPVTVRVISEYVDEFKSMGVKFTTLSALAGKRTGPFEGSGNTVEAMSPPRERD
ncbi:MAG: hypothetical protein GF408_08520 [Candidatus Omnitrophica bacterium]|nr:hypothetical protein [Candidatus Omnitrophota bacterium]